MTHVFTNKGSHSNNDDTQRNNQRHYQGDGHRHAGQTGSDSSRGSEDTRQTDDVEKLVPHHTS